MTALTGTRLNMETGRQQALARAVATTQLQISSVKRIDRASDDPAAAARISQLARSAGDVASWSENAALALSLSSEAEVILGQVSERLVQAKSLYVSAGSGSMSAPDRAVIAREIRAIATEIEGVSAARNSLDQPVFGASTAVDIPIGDGQMVRPAPDAEAAFKVGAVTLSDWLRTAADALDIADPATRAEQYGQSLADLDTLVSHVTDVHAELGVQGRSIEAAVDRLAEAKINISAERSTLEDTDIGEAVARLNSQQLALEAAQAAFARISRTTLFDILT
jgi:flagellar hook-associated protein 3 FlgL